ncbi:MAG: hypothetical protein ACRD4O_00255 [Bryobacteraceae bacterium]
MTSRIYLLLLFVLQAAIPAIGQTQASPQASISNGILHVRLYLPNATNGFYRGTRFDWSGVIRSLEYKNHNYYGPWFTNTDPKVIDFIFKGPEIVAGPCSAITGPVEEFPGTLEFEKVEAGGTFIKIGVGVLRKPDKQPYNPYRLYQIVNPGKRSVQTKPDSVTFTQVLTDAASGYAYRYTKIVRLVPGKPEMVLEHWLENTGRRRIATSVYDHNFLVLDRQTTGPDFVITFPYAIRGYDMHEADLTQIAGERFAYRKPLAGQEIVSAGFSGFGNTSADYRIRIENHKIGAGMTITGNRPLSEEDLWSIRSVIAVEPFIRMSIEPGKAFTWKYDYTYYSLHRANK